MPWLVWVRMQVDCARLRWRRLVAWFKGLQVEPAYIRFFGLVWAGAAATGVILAGLKRFAIFPEVICIALPLLLYRGLAIRKDYQPYMVPAALLGMTGYLLLALALLAPIWIHNPLFPLLCLLSLLIVVALMVRKESDSRWFFFSTLVTLSGSAFYLNMMFDLSEGLTFGLYFAGVAVAGYLAIGLPAWIISVVRAWRAAPYPPLLVWSGWRHLEEIKAALTAQEGASPAAGADSAQNLPANA